MTYYIIEVSMGNWDDLYEFPYKDIYFKDRDKAERILAILQILVDVYADNLEHCQSDGFAPLNKLDERFNYHDLPYLSIVEKKVNII